MDENCSTTCSSRAIRYDWKMIEEFDAEDYLDDYISFKLPNSLATGYRENEIKCVYNNDHRMGIQRRNCEEFENCPVKYKILKCSTKNTKFWQLKFIILRHHKNRSTKTLN